MICNACVLMDEVVEVMGLDDVVALEVADPDEVGGVADPVDDVVLLGADDDADSRDVDTDVATEEGVEEAPLVS